MDCGGFVSLCLPHLVYSGSMLAPKAGSDLIFKLKRTLAPNKMAGLASWYGKEPRLHKALHLLPLLGLQIQQRLGQVDSNDRLATNKILFACEIRMEYGG